MLFLVLMTSAIDKAKNLLVITHSVVVFRIRPCGTIFSSVDSLACRLSVSNVKAFTPRSERWKLEEDEGYTYIAPLATSLVHAY